MSKTLTETMILAEADGKSKKELKKIFFKTIKKLRKEVKR